MVRPYELISITHKRTAKQSKTRPPMTQLTTTTAALESVDDQSHDPHLADSKRNLIPTPNPTSRRTTMDIVLPENVTIIERNTDDGRIMAKRELGDRIGDNIRIAILDAWDMDEDGPGHATFDTDDEGHTIVETPEDCLIETTIRSAARVGVGAEFNGKRVRLAVLDVWSPDEPTPPFYVYVDSDDIDRRVQDSDVGARTDKGTASRRESYSSDYGDKTVLVSLIDTWEPGGEPSEGTVIPAEDGEGFYVRIPSTNHVLRKRTDVNGQLRLGSLGDIGVRTAIVDVVGDANEYDVARETFTDVQRP